MPGLAVIGAQWGDEGKGKIIDLLAARSRMVVRFHGGNNAGHTLVVGKERLVLHLIPSGILHPEAVCAIGNGVVVDPLVLLDELHMLRDLGIEIPPARLKISPTAHLIMPYHRTLDLLREEARGQGSIGTTGRGIGPCYEDKIAREGVRLGDLLDKKRLQERLEQVLPYKNLLLKKLFGREGYSARELSATHFELGKKLKQYIEEPSLDIEKTAKNHNVLFEGAQGVLLDIDHGTYPYVTSSNAVAASAAIGSGVSLRAVKRVLGVTKAYTTRVGSGPFPTEGDEKTSELLRRQGGEFGATTGRPRRCGALDLVALRYAVRVGGIDCLAVTKLDVLSGYQPLQVAVAYKVGKKEIEQLPSADLLPQAQPVYRQLPPFTFDPQKVKSLSDLPAAARDYLQLIEQACGVPIALVGVGAERQSTLTLFDPFAGP